MKHVNFLGYRQKLYFALLLNWLGEMEQTIATLNCGRHAFADNHARSREKGSNRFA